MRLTVERESQPRVAWIARVHKEPTVTAWRHKDATFGHANGSKVAVEAGDQPRLVERCVCAVKAPKEEARTGKHCRPRRSFRTTSSLGTGFPPKDRPQQPTEGPRKQGSADI